MAALGWGRPRLQRGQLGVAVGSFMAVVSMVLTACSSGGSGSAGGNETSAGTTSAVASATTASSAATGGPSGAPSSAAPTQTEDVNLAIGTASLGYAVAYLTQQEGFFNKHGLNVKFQITQGGAAGLAAIVSGSVQFVAGTAPLVLQSIKKGESLQFVAPLVNEFDQQWIANAAAAKKWGLTPNMTLAQIFSALKGKKAKVAVLDTGGLLELLFTGEAKANGLSSSDYTVTAIKPYSSMLAAVDRGQVDLAIVATPYGTEDTATGKTQMVLDLWGGQGGSDLAGALFEAIFTSTKYIQGHETEVSEFNAAINDTVNFMHTQPSQALAALEANDNYKTIPPDVLKDLVGSFESYPTSSKVTMQSWNVMKSITQTLLDPTVADITYAQSVWPQAQES